MEAQDSSALIDLILFSFWTGFFVDGVSAYFSKPVSGNDLLLARHFLNGYCMTVKQTPLFESKSALSTVNKHFLINMQIARQLQTPLI